MNDPIAYANWCRNLFESLAEGGQWAVPRSGLIFIRRGEELILDEACLIPTEQDARVLDGEQARMPFSKEELHAYQEADFETIREHFAAAGITVRR